MPCFFEVTSGLFSLVVEDSGLASTILFSVIGFLDELSLALSTDIGFPYRNILLSNRRTRLIRDPPRIGRSLFLPWIVGEQASPVWLCKQMQNLEQLLNDGRASVAWVTSYFEQVIDVWFLGDALTALVDVPAAAASAAFMILIRPSTFSPL